MSLESHEQRISHLETIQEIHGEMLKNITAVTKEFTQIKHIALGACALYATQTEGAVEVLKALITP